METKARTIGSEGGHWYNDTGLVVAVPSADNKKLIKPNVRHARKGLVVPSTTGILSILDKPALNLWKIKEHVKATLAVESKRSDESFDDYFERVSIQMNRHNDHAQVGTNIHAEIAKGITGKPYDNIAEKAVRFVLNECNKYQNPIIKSEMPFCHWGYGFGGTVDLAIITDEEVVFIDFKTTDDDKLEQGGKLAYKDSHLAQLVAYDFGTEINIINSDRRYINVFVGRIDGDIYVHEWSDINEINWARRHFMLCLELYKHKNGLN